MSSLIENPPPAPTHGYVRALDGAPLYCVHHPAAPVANPQRRYYPVVIVPPLFEERKSAYAGLRRLAERLALSGRSVMRFDYRGSGESGGVPAVRLWSHLAEDVAVVRKTLARLSGARDSVLLGLRMGATLALQETIRAGGEAVVALAPIVKGSTQVRLWKMRSKIRSELTQENAGGSTNATAATSDVLDFDGYEVGQAFFDDVAKVDLIKDLGALSCPGQLIQLSHRTDAAPETLELQKVLGSRARCTSMRIEPFWDKVDDVDTHPIENDVIKFLDSV